MMNIYEAIGSIMKKGAVISKDKRNAQQGFQYRGIDDVMNVYAPLMAEAGIFVVPEVIDSKREERQTSRGGNLIYSILTVRYTFYAKDGTFISAVVIGEGMDSGDKASNKALAAAMKYAMFQTFCIPTEEMHDPDAETPPESTPVPKVERKPEPKAEPLPEPKEASDGYFYCDDCGGVIGNVIARDGHTMYPKEVAAITLHTFGKQLCEVCSKKQKKGGQNA